MTTTSRKRRNGPKPKKLDPAKVEGLAATGATNEQIAAELGISVTSLKNARRRQKKVDQAIRRGKDKADLQVVAALYNKAVGYDMPNPNDPDKPYHVPGDVTAMIFWLKNRRPGEWKDRHDVRAAAVLTARLSMAEMKKSLRQVEG